MIMKNLSIESNSIFFSGDFTYSFHMESNYVAYHIIISPEIRPRSFFGQFCYFSYDFLDLYLILDFILISFVLFGF